MDAHSQASYCIVNGRLVAAEEAVVSIHDRGFRYGDGVFETIAVRGGKPYLFDWHIARLDDGLRAIRIACDIAAIIDHSRQLLQKNAVHDGLLRIQVTRGSGGRGYLPDPSTAATIVIETSPLPALPPEPVKLWQSHYAKISPRALPVQYKLCQGLNSTLARMEAAENDCFEALLLNEQGQLCETSSGNLFWIGNGKLYTPALACGLLEGATRAAVMRLSPYPVEEVAAGIDALRQAEAVFITNTVWGALAVGQLLPADTRWQSDRAARDFSALLARDWSL